MGSKAWQSGPEIKFVCKGHSEEDFSVVAKGAILHQGKNMKQQLLREKAEFAADAQKNLLNESGQVSNATNHEAEHNDDSSKLGTMNPNPAKDSDKEQEIKVRKNVKLMRQKQSNDEYEFYENFLGS